MKTKKLLAVLLTAMAVAALAAFSQSAAAAEPYTYTPADGKPVVYVSNSGKVNASTGAKEFTSVTEAVKAVASGGYVVLLEDMDMDGADFGAHSGMVTIRGRDDGDPIVLTNRHMRKILGPTTFESIHLSWKKKSDQDNDMSILTEGYELVMGEGVESVGDDIALTGVNITVNSGTFIIRFATWGAKATFDKAEINIGGGTIKRICPTWTGPDSTITTVEGDIDINISGGTLQRASLVNNNTLAVKGNITFNITGGTVNGTMMCVDGGTFSVGGVKRLLAQDYTGTLDIDKSAFDTIKTGTEEIISDREPKPLEPEMDAVRYYRENAGNGFIYELRPENGTEIPSGTMRYETQYGYYPLGKLGIYKRPEIYPWNTATMEIDGDFYKFIPKSSSDISLTFDTTPTSYYWSYSQPFFTFAVKTSRAFEGKITFRTLNSQYQKEFPVSFTGEWQKVILDLSDVQGWTSKGTDGSYSPVLVTPFSDSVNSLYGGHNIKLYGNGHTDYYMFDYIALFPTYEEAEAFKGIAEIKTVGVSEVKPTLDNPIGSRYFLNGYTDNSFQPDAGMKRSEVCTVIARLLSSEAGISEDRETGITDIKKDDWYYSYITYLEKLGYIGALIGTDGSVDAGKSITRAEFVKIVYDAGGFEKGTTDKKFSDVTEDTKFSEEIYSAVAAGVVNGYPDGTFLPDKTLSRAEIAAIISRILGIEEVKTGHKFTDLDESHWGYGVIMAVVKQNEPTPDYKNGELKIAEVDAKAAELKNSILNSETAVNVTGTKYYVSSSTGNDENDGKTPETAWKTLAKVSGYSFAKGDGVFLKRGDLFRERIIIQSGVTYSAYGEGNKPEIYGSPKSGAVASDWELYDAENNIWRYKEKVLDQGSIYLDGKLAIKQIPNFKNGQFITAKGEKYDVSKELKGDLWMFSETNELLGSNGLPQREKSMGYLYLRCDAGNPGEVFETVEFIPTFHLARPSNSAYHFEDVTIDNLAIKFVGAHGIHATYGNNYTVQNCVFEYIGGGIQSYTYNPDRPTRFGNAVEVGYAKGHTVKNCYINQIYDAGLTFQHGNSSNDELVLDVTYEGNLIENCVYSIEYFTGTPKTEGADKYIKNFIIKNNIMRFAGTGFSEQRPNLGNAAHLMGWNHYNVVKDGTFVIEGNIFDRSTDMLVRTGVSKKDHLTSLPVYKNNTYIQYYSADPEHIKASFGIYSHDQTRIPYDLSIAGRLNKVGIFDTDNIYFVK